MRKILLVTAALAAAVLVFLLATLPPAPRHAAWGGDPGQAARTMAGAYHVHTSRSDGARDRAAVAEAAAAAGLRFLIFTDHGDGTRAPEAPAYLSGVLCLDGVEISTNGGHYIALGMAPAPYPLGGEPSAVVEDVARLGGAGVVAHPDSARPELAWSDWTLPFDGLEWINADSEWRDEPGGWLARTVFDYAVRPGPALASMLDRPAATLARWDALSAARRVIALAGHDAHGGIGRGAEDGGRQGIPLPSYEASFRTFSTRVVLDAPPSGDAAADARSVLDAIRAGRVFTAIDAVAAPALLDLRGGPEGIAADASMPPGAELVLLRNGVEIASTRQGHIRADSTPGAFRVEVRVPGAPGTPPVPWILSNAVYAVEPAAPSPERTERLSRMPIVEALSWHIEHDPSSGGTVSESRGSASLEYRLGSGGTGSQFAALVADLPNGMAGADAVLFRAAASRPMRVSVQLKFGGEARWGTSVYADTGPRDVSVPLDRMRPLDGQTGPLPAPASASALLFVIDLTNARPGDSGVLTISSLAWGVRGGT